MSEETLESKLARIERMANAGLKPGAAQLCRLILEKDPRNIPALVWLARTTLQPDEADRAMQQAAQLAPNDPLVRELVVSRQGNFPAGVAATGNPYPGSGFGMNSAGFGPPDTPPPPAPSSFDYLQMLNTSTPPAPPPPTYSSNVANPVVPSAKKRSGSPVGLVLGVLLLLIGLGAGIVWTIMVAGFSKDAGEATRAVSGQIVNLSPYEVRLDTKDQGQRIFSYSSQDNAFYKNLAPLISSGDKLVPNSVVLNVTPGDHVSSAQVLTPKSGTINGGLSGGVSGFGTALDWVFSAVCLLVALLGLTLLTRSVKRRA